MFNIPVLSLKFKKSKFSIVKVYFITKNLRKT